MNIGDDQHATVTDLFGCRPRQLYGMTETIAAVLTDEQSQPVASSMGFVSPHCDVDVQGDDGRSVAPGEQGEVVVRGEPGITIFDGYLDMPEVTQQSFRDGWFLTGDHAHRDGDGRHFFDGRHSEVLKVSGENVSTVEVESVLSQHPKVLEAAVVGRPEPIATKCPWRSWSLSTPPTHRRSTSCCGGASIGWARPNGPGRSHCWPSYRVPAWERSASSC